MIGDDWIESIKSTNFDSNSPHSKQPPSLLSGTQHKYSLHHNQWNLGEKKNKFIFIPQRLHKHQISPKLLFTPMQMASVL